MRLSGEFGVWALHDGVHRARLLAEAAVTVGAGERRRKFCQRMARSGAGAVAEKDALRTHMHFVMSMS